MRAVRSASSLPGTALSAAPPLNSLSASAKWVIASLSGAGLRSCTMIFDFVSGPHCGGRLAPFFLPFFLPFCALASASRPTRAAPPARSRLSSMHAPLTPPSGSGHDCVPQDLAELHVRDDLAIDAALGAPLLQVVVEVLLQLGVVLLLLVDLRLVEVDAGRLVDELVPSAVVLDEERDVLDRLVVLAETATEERRRVERDRRFLLARELLGELLVVVGRLVVRGDVLEVAADLVDRLLRQRRVRLGLEQQLARLDRRADQLGALEVDGGVVVDLVELRIVRIVRAPA